MRRAPLFALGGVLVLVLAAAWWLTRDDAPAPVDPAPHAAAATQPAPSLVDRPSRAAQRPAAVADPGADTPPNPPSADATLAGDGGAVAAGGDAGLDPEAVKAAARDWLQKNAAAAERHVDEFCRRSKALASTGHFVEPPRTRDAAVYMSVRCDWEGNASTPPRVGLLHLGQPLIDRMGTPPKNWLNFQLADLQGLDFSWLSELGQFDYWSLSADGPIRNQDTSAYVDAPLPNMITLQHWAKLRLVKGLRENDLPRAAAEVRHLGQLCASNGTMLGEMYRLALLGIERGVWEAAGQPLPPEATSSTEQQDARRAEFSSMYFLMPGVPKAVKEKALGCGVPRCAMLTEAIGATASLRDVAPATDEDLGWLLAQRPCDEGLAMRLSKGAPMKVGDLASSFTGPPGVDKLFPPDAG
jgi:hypothetical protein